MTKVPNEPIENPQVAMEENQLRYLFRTPPARNLNLDPNNYRESTCTPNSGTSAETARDSTITKARKESQAVREDFRNSLAQLSQVHSRLAQENSEHAMRADVIMRDMDEMRRGLLEIQAEGRQYQGRLEASRASLNDLIKQRQNLADTRMAEMSAVMKERDRQADERIKLMSDIMQRRETDANVRSVDLMTTMKDLTLRVRAMVSQAGATQTQAAPMAPTTLNLNIVPSTSAPPPPTKVIYRKMAQPSAKQIRPAKLIPPATSKRDPIKAIKMAEISHADSLDLGTDPSTDASSFVPFAPTGASTTGHYCSPASGMTTRESNYYTAQTNVNTNPPNQTYVNLVPQPLATRTQRKLTSKRDLEQDQSEAEEVPAVMDETPDTPRTSQRQALAEPISTAMSKGLEPFLAFKESKNKPTKYRGTKDGNADGWMMLMKRRLEKVHARATPLD